MGLFEKITDYDSDFTTYGLTFENYKWHRPLLVIILAAILFIVFSLVIIELFNATSSNDIIIQILITALTVITFIPAFYIALKIVKDRPFSTYLAQNRNWNWSIYFKALAITFVMYLILTIITTWMDGKPINNTLTVFTFLLIVILTPVQCFAEEFVCRGFLMQAFGSWFKIPIVAIVLQAIVFSCLHINFTLAFYSFLIIGIGLGFVAHYSKGLEVSSAIHAINNLFAFTLTGLGLGASSDIMSVSDFLLSLLLIFASITAILLLEKKFNFFGFDAD